MSWKEIAAFGNKKLKGRLDFFNIAILLKKRTQKSILGLWTHYHWRELFIRSGIFASIIVFGIMAANTCNTENCSSLARGASGALLGFFVSHTLAVIPTIKRRNKIIQDTEELFITINKKLDGIARKITPQNVFDKIRCFTQHSFHLDLPAVKSGDVVRNLIEKKTLLQKINENLDISLNTLEDHLNKNNPLILLKSLEDLDFFWDKPFSAIQKALMTEEENIFSKVFN